MAVDGQLVARTVGELRAMLAEAGDLLAGLQRVVDATRTVVGVDGAGLTLAHEDGPPRWVATTDRAMVLLEQIQQDFGEGPCLAAYAEDRVVAVEDLRRTPRWDRIAAVVGQLQVRGVLSVPVRLANQPVGSLDAYTTSPRAWSAQEIDALGALADRLGLGDALSARVPLAGERLPLHDRGKVLTHAMMMLAGGGESCADIEHLRAQGRLFGEVPSDSTVYRTFRQIGPGTLAGLWDAMAEVRGQVWRRSSVTNTAEPVVLDIDATLVEVHSENKAGTAPT
jgi:putative methionine-R-sulfoxide reductase with GAF domain